jgi:hypothetical protein
MHMHSLNWLAILVAAISTMVVGFLWYSPVLFAKAWMREMGYDPNDKPKFKRCRRAPAPPMPARLLPACFPLSPWPSFSTGFGQKTYISELWPVSIFGWDLWPPCNSLARCS